MYYYDPFFYPCFQKLKQENIIGGIKKSCFLYNHEGAVKYNKR